MNPTNQNSSWPLFQSFFEVAPRREGPSLLQDIPPEMLTPLSSWAIEQDPCTLLAGEIACGNYETAVSMIEQDTRPLWILKQTGSTPLHTLAGAPLTPEEIHTLNDLLLQRGYNPLIVDELGNTYLTLLIERQNIPAARLFLIILRAWSINRDILLPRLFTQIFQRITESSAYSYEEKRCLIVSITGLLTEEEGCRCFNDCLVKITNRHPPFAAVKLRIIMNLLEARQSLCHFRMNWYQDGAGRNLIHIVLLDSSASVDEIHLAVTALVNAGCDINHQSQNRCYPLLLVLQSLLPFAQKKWLAERFIELNAERHALHPGTTTPAFRKLLENNVEYKSTNELAELTQLLTGRCYYQEYFYLTLLSNLFSIEFQWNQDGFSISTAGLPKNETQIESWLEIEAWGFYSSLITPSHPHYNFLWKKMMDKLSPESAKALTEVGWIYLYPALLKVQGALSRAFHSGRDRSNILQITGDENPVAFVATLKTNDESYHDIGIAFQNNTAYLCNKGYGTPESGISAHPLSRHEIQQMKSEIDRGMSVIALIDRYFPGRSFRTQHKTHLVYSQKRQKVGNCPIASYTSLEMAILHAALKDLFKQNGQVAAEIVKTIKDLHRESRKEHALGIYLTYHAVQREIPINSHMLIAIGRDAVKDPSRWPIADIIIDKTQSVFPALSAYIASLKNKAPGTQENLWEMN
ncbi:hypothetical protein [Estrella lausannensis]|uniref:Uncharacterized protein n=1 Tax=Estrella lausannensis TaxID=483423 RepID=A0A0H5DQ12_9BACT|nr:hypothetical protein [Estrella lausannensis]CRX38716.1 hypothetical protein ELAC_1380 [Estrella lausannensis]